MTTTLLLPRRPGIAWRILAGAMLLAGMVTAADWEPIRGGRTLPLTVPPGGKSGWELVDPVRSGVGFTNRLSVERFTTNQIYLNGSGVAAGDVDGDGRTDLFFAGLGGGSTLYLNRGDWRFEDVTERSGIGAVCRRLDATGAVLADVDGDRDLDLVVNSTGGGTHVLSNDGHGRFTDASVLNLGRGGTSAALADLDGDGDLDLYVANYRTETLRDQPRTNFRIEREGDHLLVRRVNGRDADSPELKGRFTYLPSGSILENGEPDALFLNEGQGRFVELPFTGGRFLDESGRPFSSPLYDWGLSVMLRDLNGDGRADIYVCNDFGSPDRFWLNQGEGRFQAAPALALRNTSKFSMGMDVADVDRDGLDDLYVLDMMSRSHAVRLTRMDASMDGSPIGSIEARPQLARSTLQRNRGDGTYAEIACFAGLEATEWSWQPLFVDVDLDGFEDVLVMTGHGRDDMHLDHGMRIDAARKARRMGVLEELSLRRETPALPLRCLAFRNRGNLTFEEIPQGWGCGDVECISQGACLADLDNDGDLDVVINRMNGAAGLYRNAGSAPRVAVRLRGKRPNTQAIGARVELLGGPVPRQAQEMICGGRYLSGDESMRVFAAGTSPATLRLEVRWPGGARSVVENVQANRLYELEEEGGEEAVPATPTRQDPTSRPMFLDESARLDHRHYETPFDDFERQPLLPRRGSQAGPGVGWVDLDGDGRDDLVIASGRGGRPGVFLNSGDGGFRLVEVDPAPRDQVGVVGWSVARGSGKALLASSGYEDPEGNAAIQSCDAPGSLQEALALGPGGVGALAVADRNGDGNLELFVGGAAIGGRYPEATASRVFSWSPKGWKPVAQATAAVAGAGLVSGAIWSDLDADGFPELILACEWGPVRVYRNSRGTLREATEELGLAGWVGWWNGVAAGDFDGDGRLDLVAGNWGLNSRYRATVERPVRLYYGENSGQGQVATIEASFEPELGRWVPDRDMRAVSRQLPWLPERFPRHHDYALAGVEELFAGRAITVRHLDAGHLATTVFLRRGDRFVPVPLPAEAQWTPAVGVCVLDFDLDGAADLFLSQNFHAVSTAISRQDAGRGLLLRGDGHGGFQPISGTRSGILIYGEQRGCASSDYDGDGRPDLVVAQNAGPTRLFRNAAGPAGLRLRLRAGRENPDGIGAVVRWQGMDGMAGPAWEVHGGGGYGSQDSVVLVLPRPSGAGEYVVRWPGGTVSRHPIPEGKVAGGVTLELTRPGS